MAETPAPLGDFGHAGDDNVVPFHVVGLDARGRAVQLGAAIDAILARHAYPEPVARLLAEAAVLVVLLGTSLKFSGRFILQAATDGPVDLLVADLGTPGDLRAYARFDAGRVAKAKDAIRNPAVLLGRGTLAMTVDQGPHTSRYQGIVELSGQSLEEVARVYFRQSEQIPTDVRLAVASHHVQQGGAWRTAWRAGGVLVQFLPEDLHRMRLPDLPGGDGDDQSGDEDAPDDAWAEVLAHVGTVGDDELTDPEVGAERLLYRLFHERGVRVFEGVPIMDRCSCSREKVHAMLASFTAQEIEDSVEEGRIAVTCEFCSTRYEFDPADYG